MRRTGIFLVVLSLLLLALPVAAQEQPGVLSLVYFVNAKAGAELQFEEALKEHMNWLGQQNEAWTWGVWQRVTGKHLGQYIVGSFGHRFEDFDARAELARANREHWQANVSQYVASASSRISVSRADISLPAEEEGFAPYAWLVEHHLRVGTEDEFNYAAKKIHAAIKKTNWPVHYFWSQVINGGHTPNFILVLPAQNWAGFNRPEKPFPAMLEEALGRKGAESLIKLLNKITKAETSSIVAHRPDLSYTPSQ